MIGDFTDPDGPLVVAHEALLLHLHCDEIPDMIAAMKWPEGVIQTCIAGESGMIKILRQHLLVDKALPKQDCYISGYWKIGLIEDEHQHLKRAEAAK